MFAGFMWVRVCIYSDGWHSEEEGFQFGVFDWNMSESAFGSLGRIKTPPCGGSAYDDLDSNPA